MTTIVSGSGFSTSAVGHLKRTDRDESASAGVESSRGFSKGNRNHKNKNKESSQDDELSLSLPVPLANPAGNSSNVNVTLSLPVPSANPAGNSSGSSNVNVTLSLPDSANPTAWSHAHTNYWQQLGESKAKKADLGSSSSATKDEASSISQANAEQVDEQDNSMGHVANKLEALLSKFDRSASGTTLSLRNISLFSKVASLGAGALDKLIAAMGPEQSGALQLLQSRLENSSDKADKSDRPDRPGFSLLA